MGLFSKLATAFRTSPPPTPPGRNEPCWCGSGKKYKRCHLDADQTRRQGQQKTCVTS